VNHPVVPIASALTLALAWLPVFVRFFRSWRARGNPISIAICVLILVTLYIPVYLAGYTPPSWALATVIALSTIACVTFYVTFYYANQKFSDTRKN
jgi:hypothetical protein